MTHSGFGCGFQRPACDSLVFPRSKFDFCAHQANALKNFSRIFPNETGPFHSLSKIFLIFFLTPSAPSPIVNPMKENLLTAIDESITTASCPTVEVADIEAAANWLKRNQWDVDWDNNDGVITIFGDRPSTSDEPENWVLRLIQSA